MANSPSGDSMVSRITRVLASFDSTRVSQSASQIARRAGLPLSTAHRLVGLLVDEGLLERDGDGDVRIGIRLWELTTRGSHALELRQLAMPFMEEVQARLREHTQLGVLDHDEVLFIERLSAPDAGANITRIAGRLPLHASSSGLVLLAFAEPDFQNRILAGPLTAVSPETITDARVLRRELAAVRARGYSFAPGSIETVSTGIAVPVSDISGVIAALSVVLPRDTAREPATVAVLNRAADGIHSALARSQFRSDATF
ncbi:MAG: IclR family transcriptional regulator [Actinomycetota bacterium]|nr:IclR family transcriptional regulator [Actinomycetota bacterium]